MFNISTVTSAGISSVSISSVRNMFIYMYMYSCVGEKVKHLALSIFCARLEWTSQMVRQFVFTLTDFIICEMSIVFERDFVERRFKAIIT